MPLNKKIFGFVRGAIAVLLLLLPTALCAQAPKAPQTGKPGALIDLTGYWVAVVTQDWKQRMVTPAKGDFASVPLNMASKKIADAWDPAKDEASGEQCRSYGAPAIMRVPARLHITWRDENTLQVEIDAGTQTRLFHFGEWKPTGGPATWQGESVAHWEAPNGTRPEEKPATGSLKVVTTHARAGYLRKNGIPYSANAAMTEFWDLAKEANGEQWLEITAMVEDSQFLSEPWLSALHFKKEANGSKWDPTPCSAIW
ncbi:MAG: hypothetical protein ABL995_07530 [Bryobacteraceae bacterium]